MNERFAAPDVTGAGPRAALAVPSPEPHTYIYSRIRAMLEILQDVIITLLMAVLVVLSVQALWGLIRMAFVESTTTSQVLSEIIFILILTELYRLLIFYLREHRISVALTVEVALVSTLREVMLKGAHEFEWLRIVALSLLLAVLGGLLALERWMGQRRGQISETDAR
jgi:uncharacterized membrane protein (DUF373 family)